MMKKYYLFLLLTIGLCFEALSAVNNDRISNIMDETWAKFRQTHPYTYQTLGLKQVGNASVIIISEPSPDVSEEDFTTLFNHYNGRMTVKQHKLGYDGWVKDVVGYLDLNEDLMKQFTSDLFSLLYSTDYKSSTYFIDVIDYPSSLEEKLSVSGSDDAFKIDSILLLNYRNLDSSSERVDFVPYKYKLNQSFSATDIVAAFEYQVQFKTLTGPCSLRFLMANYDQKLSDCVFESVKPGYVVWLIPHPSNWNDSIDFYSLFKASARQFALDTDMIIGAVGNKRGMLAIIGRERTIPVTICPPLRTETILLMAQTNFLDIEQAFVPDSTAVDVNGKHLSSIFMTDQLKNTEYGHLLIMTDQILKSWIENNYNQDCDYNLPAPSFFPFSNGLSNELQNTEVNCFWELDNLTSIFHSSDSTTFYSINQIGSLPVSFETENSIETDILNEAEKQASLYFANLNQPELFRTAQYTALCQIFYDFWNSAYANDTIEINDITEDYTPIPDDNYWLKTPSFSSSNEEWNYGGARFKVKGVKKWHNYNPSLSRLQRAQDYLRKYRYRTTTTRLNKTRATPTQLTHGVAHSELIHSGVVQSRVTQARTPRIEAAQFGVTGFIKPLFETLNRNATKDLVKSAQNTLWDCYLDGVDLETHFGTVPLSDIFTIHSLLSSPDPITPSILFDHNPLYDSELDYVHSRKQEIDYILSSLVDDSYLSVLPTIRQYSDKIITYQDILKTLHDIQGDHYFNYVNASRVTKGEMNFLLSLPTKYGKQLKALTDIAETKCLRLPSRLTVLSPQIYRPSRPTTFKVQLRDYHGEFKKRHKKNTITFPDYSITIKSPRWPHMTRLEQSTSKSTKGNTRGFDIRVHNQPYWTKKSIVLDKQPVEIKDIDQLRDVVFSHSADETHEIKMQHYSAAEDVITVDGKTCIVPRKESEWNLKDYKFEGSNLDNIDKTITYNFQQEESTLQPGCKSSKVSITIPQKFKNVFNNFFDRSKGIFKKYPFFKHNPFFERLSKFYYEHLDKDPELYRNIENFYQFIPSEDFELKKSQLTGHQIFLQYNETDYCYQSAA